tara:strand:- start:3295 stop:4005 length:711 start_codon:yes stop_codon:yes gene_type:complete
MSASVLYNSIENFYKKKIVFLHIPKTSGTTIGEEIFGDFCGHYSLTQLMNRDKDKKLNSLEKFTIVRNPYFQKVSGFLHTMTNKKSRSIYSEILNEEIPSNPKSISYEKMIQHFRNFWKNVNENYIKNECINFDSINSKFDFDPLDHLNYLYAYDHWLEDTFIDYIFKFEDRESINKWVDEKFGAKVKRHRHDSTKMYPKFNQLNYKDFYNEHTQEIVLKIYRQDFLKYNYSYNID